LALELSNEKIGDRAYFDKLAACDNAEFGTHLYNMLMRRDISSWNPIDISNTDFKRELKLKSLGLPLLYLIDLLRGDYDPNFLIDFLMKMLLCLPRTS